MIIRWNSVRLGDKFCLCNESRGNEIWQWRFRVFDGCAVAVALEYRIMIF